ncbi:MAG TPA: cation diffusion facilitator family transporter [Verrucomicrobiae bacterium]|nr:cation diffusion facilitator family transporter [Verrucomicrobiae bacterium]
MPTDRLQRSLKATFLGMAVNVVLSAVKFTAGVLGHSHALIADAVESGADILSSIVVWRALVLAAEPADREHPYGHGKAEPLAAATVATMLLVAAAGIILKSLQDLALPRQAPRAFTLIVLIAVVVIKETLFRFVAREAGSVESIVVYADAWHHRSDAVTSLAAAIGISLALLGGPRFFFADDAAAIVAGLIIAWNGWKLLKPAYNELMDAAPGVALVAQIKSAASQVAGVKRIEKCIVRKAGYEYFVDMHVEVDPELTVRQAHQIAHLVKDSVRASMPSVHDVLVHIEPYS